MGVMQKRLLFITELASGMKYALAKFKDLTVFSLGLQN